MEVVSYFQLYWFPLDRRGCIKHTRLNVLLQRVQSYAKSEGFFVCTCAFGLFGYLNNYGVGYVIVIRCCYLTVDIEDKTKKIVRSCRNYSLSILYNTAIGLLYNILSVIVNVIINITYLLRITCCEPLVTSNWQ